MIAGSSPERSSSVLVVGAGPAGATAARALARAGVQVTLLDRAASAAGPQSGLAGHVDRAQHDGRDAANGHARCRSLDPLGGVRAPGLYRLFLYLPEAGSRQRRHRMSAVPPSRGGPRVPLRRSARVRRFAALAWHHRRRVGPAELHAFHDSGGRPPAPAGTRTRPAGRRRGRFRERVHGGRHLLRDGVWRFNRGGHSRV